MERNASIIPCFRYKDAPAALEWLCQAFGFEKHAVYEGKNGAIEHAQLTFGNGMIMLSTARDDEFGKLMKSPAEAGVNTGGSYLIVADPDAHHARAVKAGARVVYALRDEDYGGRGYSCLDPEGYVWSFGSYDPWKPAT